MEQERFRSFEKRETNQMVFGIRAIMEAIQSGQEIESLFIQRGIGGPLMQELRQVLRDYDVPYQQVPLEKLNRITRKNHQGAIAIISPIAYNKIENIVPLIFEKGENPLILILDSITDVRNLGAIARTAECSGVHALVVPQKGSAEINPDTIKTSAGALFNIDVCREENLAKTVKFLQESGIQVVVSTEKTEDSLYEVDFTVPTALVLGSEEFGVSSEIIRIADKLARIPMVGKTGSLNVSVSAGVVLYEAIRQRI